MTIKAVLNIIPSPLLDIFGAQFCEWIDLPGNIYMTGFFLWSALTAIYRVLFIRATTWIRRKNNEKRVLVICLTLGFVLHIPLALWMTKYDAWSGFEKLCTHYSNDEINIMLAYQVDKQNWYQKYFSYFNVLWKYNWKIYLCKSFKKHWLSLAWPLSTRYCIWMYQNSFSRQCLLKGIGYFGPALMTSLSIYCQSKSIPHVCKEAK